MQRLLLRYTQALLTQMCQTAACNRHHSIDQQLCRWLLLTLDRLPSNELVMTQELVASALGVRRESVTEAAGKLQRAGFVRYRRGHISVLDRAGLETGACECYAVVKKEIRASAVGCALSAERRGGHSDGCTARARSDRKQELTDHLRRLVSSRIVAAERHLFTTAAQLLRVGVVTRPIVASRVLMATQ